MTAPNARRILMVIMLVTLTLSAGSFRVVQAQTNDTFTPEIPIPNLFTGPQAADNNLLANYIRAIFTYFIWVVGIVAVVMVMYGGVKWVAAAGNPGQIKDARDVIDNAVIGVIIALVSVVLLNTINPKLTKLSLSGVTNVDTIFYDSQYVTSICGMQLQDTHSLTCGQAFPNGGTTVDRNGKTVPTYCMATICPKGFFHRPSVCQLDAVPLLSDPTRSGYKVLAGCQDTFSFSASSLPGFVRQGQIQSAATLIGDPAADCGRYTSPIADHFGTKCAEWNGDVSHCYLIGEKINGDNTNIIKEMQCPAQ